MSTAFPVADSVGRLIDGRFTLLRQLGGAGSSSVFLTEFGEELKRKAAIKLVAADKVDAQACVARWERAKALSHPHLIGIFDHGRCELDGKDILYVVTEYADEVLSEILSERALTTDETREMLAPILGALAFLHGQNLVHGHLKPSNILVVNDRLKLSADGIVAASEVVERSPSSYDAPEIGTGKIAPSADFWSLGMVLVQALTQKLPMWNRSKAVEPEVPASIPEPFFDMAREYLRIDPALRLTLSGIEAHLDPGQAEELAEKKSPAPPVAPAAEKNSAPPAAPARESHAKPTLKNNVQAVLGTLAVLGLAWLVMKAGSHRAASAPTPRPSVSVATVAPSPSAAPAAPSSGPVVKGEIASQTLPDIPPKISGAIHGHIKVGIRVQVDAQGNVTQASIDSPGPSRYFADQALRAAQKWKFTPAWIGGRTVASAWIVHFRFSAEGSDAGAQEETP